MDDDNIIYRNIQTKCGEVVGSGGSGLTVKEHFVPSENGEITFSYTAHFISDYFKVESQGIVYIDTGVLTTTNLVLC